MAPGSGWRRMPSRMPTDGIGRHRGFLPDLDGARVPVVGDEVREGAADVDPQHKAHAPPPPRLVAPAAAPGGDSRWGAVAGVVEGAWGAAMRGRAAGEALTR